MNGPLNQTAFPPGQCIRAQYMGRPGYAEEELLAEMCAAFRCADLNMPLHSHENHTHYIGHWLNVHNTTIEPSSTGEAACQSMPYL